MIEIDNNIDEKNSSDNKKNTENNRFEIKFKWLLSIIVKFYEEKK